MLDLQLALMHVVPICYVRACPRRTLRQIEDEEGFNSMHTISFKMKLLYFLVISVCQQVQILYLIIMEIMILIVNLKM